MRLFSVLFGVMGAAIIAFVLGHHLQPPPDGNPIGYHLKGLVRFDQSPQLSCNNQNTCNLQFDIYFDPNGAPVQSASCGTQKQCFVLHNVPADKLGSTLNVTIDEATGANISEPGYASGSIAGS